MKTRVLAMPIPSLTFDDLEAARTHIAAVTTRGEWIALESGTAGFEAAALARVAALAKTDRLECDASLLEAGRGSGWSTTSEKGLEETRALAALSILLSEAAPVQFPLGVISGFLESAAAIVAKSPWNESRFRKKLPPLIAETDSAEAEALSEYTLRITPPDANCCPEAWIHFERKNGEPLIAAFEGSAWQPAFLDSFLESRGFSGLPVAYSENPREEMRALSTDEFASLAVLLDLVAQAQESRGVLFSSLRTHSLSAYGSWFLPAEPARRSAKKLGRNAPCHCGSGEKYKECHLTADRLTGLPPTMKVAPLGTGLTDLIVATDGQPVPEGGYHDCEICQAKTPAEKMRLMLKFSGETIH